MEPKRLGQRAAWILFGALALVHVVAVGVPWHWGRMVAWLGSGALIPVVGLVAALVITFVLPRPARRPFWVTGAICMGLTVALLGMTCGYVLVSNRLGLGPG